jgi:hypothetical protein
VDPGTACYGSGMTNLYRLLLVLAAVVAGVLNGSPLAAPVLIFMAYLLAVLVHQGQSAMHLYYLERHRGYLPQTLEVHDAASLAR